MRPTLANLSPTLRNGFVTLFAPLALLAACDSGAAPSDGDPTPVGDPLAINALEVVEPGGDTMCSRGTPYRFAALGGDPKRVVIDFAGGGACWNATTCSVAGAIFFEEAPTREDFASFISPDGGVSGIYDRDNAANPVDDWTLVHVSYCTGDIHIGDATHTYDDDVTIAHRGYRNVQAVLDWTQARYPAPEAIHVTGCSAGAYGAIAYTNEIRRRWPKATITVLADSGAGIVTEDFAETAFDNWNVWSAVGVDSLTALYTTTAEANPDIRIAQFSSAYDVRQSFYYGVMGGQADWTEALMTSLSGLDAALPTFRTYVAPGPGHCILSYPSYYTRDAGPDTIPFAAWSDAFINGAELPPSQSCADSGCDIDPVCDACKAGSDAPECRFCNNWE